MNQIKVLLFFTILAFAANLNAQTLKAYQKTLKNALDSGEYATALNTYKVILDDAKKGETQMYFDAANLAHDLTVYEMAERYYLKVIESEEAASFPMTNYRLGMVQKSLGKYSAADSSFQRYIASSTSGDNAYLAKAKKEREDCIWAQEQLLNAQDLDIQRKDSIVNTSCHTEIAPLYHEGQLYFTTVREEENPNATSDDPIHQIFSTVGDSIAIRLSDGFNKTGIHTGHTAFSADGNRLFFTICDGKQVDRLRCHIYYKEKGENGIWGEEVKLSDQINLDSFTSTQPNIAMDGDQELLFFSSDRPGGQGGLDIWCSAREANGEFGAPFNIQKVNTPEDDMTPFYHAKTHNLYFSSNGRQNMGGFDTYKIRKQGTSWGDVQHMGAPVNGSYDDVFYTVSDETGKAYFSSNRPATVCDDYPIEGPICSDIYSYDVPKVDLLALTFACGKELKECEVTLIDLSTKERFPVSTEDYNRAEYVLELDRNYMLIGHKENYKGDTLMVNTNGLSANAKLDDRRLELKPYIKLNITTINSLRSTKLLGAEITVLNITLNKEVSPNANSGSSLFPFTLEPGYRYKITARKACFNPATTVVSTIDPCLPNPLDIDLKLNPGFQSPPVVLFFDNDRPNRRTMDTTATVDYQQTFKAYMKKKGAFQGALQSFPNELALISTFFQDSVQTGFDSLDRFSANLLEYLKCNDDTKVEVIIQGYASPLSNPDYNLNLTKRRVDCVKKYFAAYGKGELGNYMRGDESRLIVKLVPNGDLKAIGGKNDRKDRVNSIYNVAASRERRVEIIRVDITENN